MVDDRIIFEISDIIDEDVFIKFHDSTDVFDQLVYEFSHISLLERDLPSLSPSEASEELGRITEEVIMGCALELTDNRLPQDDVFLVRDSISESLKGWSDRRTNPMNMSGEEALEYLNYLMYECPWRPWA